MKRKIPPSDRLLKEYGLTLGQWQQILATQHGACAICGDGKAKLVIDHCHTTGKVRGLLCNPCNMGLGSFKDNRRSLRAAVRYLDSLCPTDPRPLPIAEPDVKPDRYSGDSSKRSLSKLTDLVRISTGSVDNSSPGPPASPLPDRLGHLANWRSTSGFHLFPKPY